MYHLLISSSQPKKLGPVAAFMPSEQQPNFVSLHVLQSPEPSMHSKHPSLFGPVARVMPSGQHPNLREKG